MIDEITSTIELNKNRTYLIEMFYTSKEVRLELSIKSNESPIGYLDGFREVLELIHSIYEKPCYTIITLYNECVLYADKEYVGTYNTNCVLEPFKEAIESLARHKK